MKESLQGKSGEEVIVLAESIKKARVGKGRAQALSEIKELEAAQAKAKQAQSELAKFKIERSRYKQQQDFMGMQPIIELTVVNGTGHAISRAHFKGTIASPGRSVPWIMEDFNFKISGGLEPREKATWVLEPNRFSQWAKPEIPADAIFTAEVEQLDGADGEPLFSVKNFSEDDRKRLIELKKAVQ